MTMIVTTNSPNWKVDARVQSKKMKCPRCGNETVFNFCVGLERYEQYLFFKIPIEKIYGFKCSICPYVETVDAQVAKALVKRGRV